MTVLCTSMCGVRGAHPDNDQGMWLSDGADHLDECRVIHGARDSDLVHCTPIWASDRLEDLQLRRMTQTSGLCCVMCGNAPFWESAMPWRWEDLL